MQGFRVLASNMPEKQRQVRDCLVEAPLNMQQTAARE
jgi:hypothetical protein